MNMISKFVRKCVFASGVFVVLAAGVSSVQAGPFVDPTLAQTGTVKVIVMLRDQVAPAKTFRSTATYLNVRQTLEQNARVSQKGLLDVLKGQPGFASSIRVRPLWIINAVVVTLPASQVSILQSHPDVRAIYRSRRMHIIQDYRSPSVVSGDPFTYGLGMMNIPELRKEIPAAIGTGITVGILDTGVDATHSDLKGKIVGWHDFVNDKNVAYDDHGHGTHVSGTIGGGATSGTAIGVAPGVKMIMGKVFGSDGSSDDETLLKGMQWIADPDNNPATHDQPSIVSNSWGGGEPSPSADPADDVFCQALSSWLKLGIYPVFAAGNEGPGKGTAGTPGACPQALAVGATDKNDAIASFSSRGPSVWKTGAINKPNISAPGVSILSAKPDGGYQTMSGTSMATPHIAGMMSLIYQAMPNITIEDATKIATGTSKDLGAPGVDPVFGAGRADALAAVKAAHAFRAAHLR